MRLTADQAEVIRTAVREVYGEDSRLWLFGSRVDDEQRGEASNLSHCLLQFSKS